MADKGVSDRMRTVLNDYKHSRIGLGVAMKRLKDILYKTNDDYFLRGNVSGRWFRTGEKQRDEKGKPIV